MTLPVSPATSSLPRGPHSCGWELAAQLCFWNLSHDPPSLCTLAACKSPTPVLWEFRIDPICLPSAFQSTLSWMGLGGSFTSGGVFRFLQPFLSVLWALQGVVQPRCPRYIPTSAMSHKTEHAVGLRQTSSTASVFTALIHSFNKQALSATLRQARDTFQLTAG